MEPSEPTHSFFYHLLHPNCPCKEKTDNYLARNVTDITINEKLDGSVNQKADVIKRIQSSMLMSAIGDTIGYGSGHDPYKKDVFPWEAIIDGRLMSKILDKHYNGDYRNIHFTSEKEGQRWVVSDDTILQMEEAKAIIAALKKDPGGDVFAIVDQMAKNFAKRLDWEISEGHGTRSFGTSTYACYQKYHEKAENWRTTIEFQPKNVGCGSSMRGMVFGLEFFGEKNRKKLIPIALYASALTSQSATGILGGLSSALITAFIMEDLPIGQWIPQLFEEFKHAKQFLKDMSKNGDISQTERDFAKECIKNSNWNYTSEQWNQYYQMLSNKKPSLPTFDTFPQTLDGECDFHSHFLFETDDYKSQVLGNHAHSAVILAHHGLLYSIAYLVSKLPKEIQKSINPKEIRGSDLRNLLNQLDEKTRKEVFDRIVKFTAFHGGDTDSTCCIALGFYGALLGFNGVEAHQLEEVEFHDEILKMGKLLSKLHQ